MNYINTLESSVSFQKTLKRRINFSGVGVHNGRAVSMSIEPAEINTGIVFYRTDLEKNNIINQIGQRINGFKIFLRFWIYHC